MRKCCEIIVILNKDEAVDRKMWAQFVAIVIKENSLFTATSFFVCKRIIAPVF